MATLVLRSRLDKPCVNTIWTMRVGVATQEQFSVTVLQSEYPEAFTSVNCGQIFNALVILFALVLVIDGGFAK